MTRWTCIPQFLAIGLVLACASSSRASFYSSILAQGANSFDDQDREAYVDVDGDGKLSLGDVLLGFVRLDDHDPIVSGVGPIENRIYAIFSQQVKTITIITVGSQPVFGQIDFEPTTATGLTLSEIVPGASANGVLALYSSPVPITDLINNSPGDLTGNGTTNLFDYFKLIKDNMTLSAIAGFGSGPTNSDDYFTATTNTSAGLGLLATGGAATIPNISQSVTVANFTAGLTILQNFEPTVIYNELVVSTRDTLHELVIKNGNVSGMNGASFANQWSSIRPDLSYTEAQNPGGFVTDADFVVNVTVIPEPSAFVVMGGLIVMLGAAASRVYRRTVV